MSQLDMFSTAVPNEGEVIKIKDGVYSYIPNFLI